MVGYEGFSTLPTHFFIKGNQTIFEGIKKMVGYEGFEPPTH